MAQDVRVAIAASRRARAESLAAAIEAGAKLIEAKGLLSHGQWLSWLRDQAGISDRSARAYMRLARSGLDIGSAANLGIRSGLDAIAEAADAQMPLPMPGELMHLSLPWIGFQPRDRHVDIWRADGDPRQFHCVIMLSDGGQDSLGAWTGGADVTRSALSALGMDKQIDQHGYWSRLIEADPTINIEDDVDEHLRKVRAIAERIGPNLDWEQSPSVRTITRPDAEGWKIAEELRVIAESIAAREKANRSVG